MKKEGIDKNTYILRTWINGGTKTKRGLRENSMSLVLKMLNGGTDGLIMHIIVSG